MKKLINRITIHFDKEKIKTWANSKKDNLSKKFPKGEDYYICRVCKHIYPIEKMSKDNSICDECAKR